VEINDSYEHVFERYRELRTAGEVAATLASDLNSAGEFGWKRYSIIIGRDRQFGRSVWNFVRGTLRSCVPHRSSRDAADERVKATLDTSTIHRSMKQAKINAGLRILQSTNYESIKYNSLPNDW